MTDQTTHSLSMRPLWRKLFPSTVIFGLVLILLWGIPRFYVVLTANQTGNYQWVSLIFVSMWLAPWLFLTKDGRRRIGIKRPDRPSWLLYGLLLGAVWCALMFFVATALYGDSIYNWFIYISRSYSNLPSPISPSDKMIYFAIYAVIGMTFSPIGEELFYRGLVHESFAARWGDRAASLLDSLAFSLTHLAHFGILYRHGQWEFALMPALLWVTLLFVTCLFFFLARRRSGSILGAITAHAGFNVAMMYVIFYHVL